VLLIYDRKLANRIKPKENSDKIAVVYLKIRSITDFKYLFRITEFTTYFHIWTIYGLSFKVPS